MISVSQSTIQFLSTPKGRFGNLSSMISVEMVKMTTSSMTMMIYISFIQKTIAFPNILDTIIADTDKIIFDFLITDINNNPQQDILIIRADKLRVYEDFDGVTFARIYDLDAILNSRLIYGSDLNLDGLEEIIVVRGGKDQAIHGNRFYILSILKDYSHCNINPIYYSDYNPLVFADIDLDGSTDLLSTYYRESDLSWFEFIHRHQWLYAHFLRTMLSGQNKTLESLLIQLKTGPVYL